MKVSRYAYLAAAAAVVAIAAPSHAAVIDFSNLDTSGPSGGNGAAFTTYTQAGFTVSAPVGQYVQATAANGSAPSSVPALLTGAYNGAQAASLTVSNGSTFYFSGAQFFLSPLGTQPASTYSIFAYFGNVLQYMAPATTLNSGLNTFSTGGDTTAIDRLVINTNSPGQLYVDNISVTAIGAVAGAVPEPASWAMMLFGFGAAGATLRRKKRVAVSFA